MNSKIICSNKGVTLVELLATLVILSLIGTIIYSVLFNGIKSYEKTVAETELRDEADHILANLIDVFFTMKVSDLKLDKLPNEENKLSYITKRDDKVIGFKDNKIFINNEELKLLNTNIKLSEQSKITSIGNSQFLITLVLETKDAKQKLELTSILNIIDDGKEGNQNGTN